MNLKFSIKLLSVLCILLTNLSVVFANGSQKVHISESKLSVSELIKKIESQTDYMFVYNESNINLAKVVTISKDDQSVNELLSSAFAKTDVQYEIEGNNIVFSKIALDPVKKINITGKIVDSKGQPIIGATILEQGTTNGTATNVEGDFTITANNNAKLSISAIGYEANSVSVANRTFLKITLQDTSIAVDDVVVTAMGIKRKSSTLTYSVQQIGGDNLTDNKETNLMNSLAGKIAGVNIQKGAGLGGSAKVSIRGIRSALSTGNNQPLYVIDGVPMQNSATQSTQTALGGANDGATLDFGDGISNLNSEDIESMSILKGASAAALYGSQAANGVILITTKKGHSGTTRVNFSSNLTFDNAFDVPEFQNSYGAGTNNSWGEEGKATGQDNLKDYFTTGVTAINAISLSTGNDRAQSYFSYANTTATGIIDNNELSKHNFTFRQSGKFFKDRLNLDANVNLLRQEMTNPTPTGGYYLNPLVGLYRFPRGLNMSDYSGDNSGVYDVNRNMTVQNWYASTLDNESNPYWLKDHTSTTSIRNRAIASLNASLKITDWLSLQARGTVDYIGDRQETKMDASTAPNLTSNSSVNPPLGNGRYRYYSGEQFMSYGDVMATMNKSWDSWSLTSVIGGSINVNSLNSRNQDSATAGLINANVFQLANINKKSGSIVEEVIDQRRTMQSIFATAQVGYKDAIYLDIAVRNDWSSTLAFTESKNSGFFYPSAGLSWLIHQSVDMPEWFNFAKIRGSFAEVGNDLPIFASNQFDYINSTGEVIQADTFSKDLKPEISTSWEVGFETKFFQNIVDIDFTWYRTETRNQLLRVNAPVGAPKGYQWINAGLIRNEGFEVTLGINPFSSANFSWRSQFNFSTNRNKVVELYRDPTNSDNDVTEFVYGDPGFGSMNYMMIVKEGGSLGDFYGKTFARDESGKIIKDEKSGMPTVNDKVFEKAGNNAPKAMLGWSNNFNVYGVQIGVLIDARIGGKVMSFTQADIDYYGASKVTGDARDLGFVELEGEKYTDIQRYYQSVSGIKGATSQYVYDATNIRLRELTIGYSLPRNWMEKSGVFKDVTISFVARNLFFIYNEAPFDPDASMSAGNVLQGIDVFGMPTTRNLGFNVKLTF